MRKLFARATVLGIVAAAVLVIAGGGMAMGARMTRAIGTWTLNVAKSKNIIPGLLLRRRSGRYTAQGHATWA